MNEYVNEKPPYGLKERYKCKINGRICPFTLYDFNCGSFEGGDPHDACHMYQREAEDYRDEKTGVYHCFPDTCKHAVYIGESYKSKKLNKKGVENLSKLQRSLCLYEWVYKQILAGNMELILKDLGYLEPYILIPITKDCPDTDFDVDCPKMGYSKAMGYSKTFDIFYNETTCDEIKRINKEDGKEYYRLFVSGGGKDRGKICIEPDEIKEGIQNSIKALKIAINLYV